MITTNNKKVKSNRYLEILLNEVLTRMARNSDFIHQVVPEHDKNHDKPPAGDEVLCSDVEETLE